MGAEVKLFWSALATGQFLEVDATVRELIDGCIDLIRQFPLIGVRLKTRGIDHRRRFVCAGYRIVYGLKETRLVDQSPDILKNEAEVEAASEQFEITIIRFKHV